MRINFAFLDPDPYNCAISYILLCSECRKLESIVTAMTKEQLAADSSLGYVTRVSFVFHVFLILKRESFYLAHMIRRSCSTFLILIFICSG